MRIKHPEWRASNEPSKFPFSDNATLRNAAGDTLLEGTFIDAALYPPSGQAGMYLSKVVVTGSSVTIYIGDSRATERASTTFNPAEPPANLRLTDNHGRAAGILVSEPERLAIFLAWGPGTHEFTRQATAFAAAVCIPQPGTVLQGVQLPNGEIITGDIWLVGDDGVVLSSDLETVPGAFGADDIVESVIRVDVVGDPLFRRRLCSDAGVFPTQRFLESLSFCLPPIAGTDGVPTSTVSDATDILFVTDTTGSMGSYLTSIKTVFAPLAREISSAFPDVDLRWGVADYKDFSDVGYGRGWRIGQTFTDSHALAQLAINRWVAGGGGNLPEAQLRALRDAANVWESELKGRSIANAGRIIVWAGDVPGHGFGETHLGYPTLGETISALQSAGISVVAINKQASGSGIDDNYPDESKPAEDLPEELTKQASTIVANTGGVLKNSVNTADADAVKEAIVDLLNAVIIEGTDGIPGSPQICYSCGPGTLGDVKITVGSSEAADTILRVRAVPTGLIIETVGEKIEEIG